MTSRNVTSSFGFTHGRTSFFGLFSVFLGSPDKLRYISQGEVNINIIYDKAIRFLANVCVLNFTFREMSGFGNGSSAMLIMLANFLCVAILTL